MARFNVPPYYRDREALIRFFLYHGGWAFVLPGWAWIQIAFSQNRFRLFDALAKVVLDDPALLLVAECFGGLRATAASGRAQRPVGKYPRVFRCPIRLLFRHCVLVSQPEIPIMSSGNQLKWWDKIIENGKKVAKELVANIRAHARRIDEKANERKHTRNKTRRKESISYYYVHRLRCPLWSGQEFWPFLCRDRARTELEFRRLGIPLLKWSACSIGMKIIALDRNISPTSFTFHSKFIISLADTKRYTID